MPHGWPRHDPWRTWSPWLLPQSEQLKADITGLQRNHQGRGQHGEPCHHYFPHHSLSCLEFLSPISYHQGKTPWVSDHFRCEKVQCSATLHSHNQLKVSPLSRSSWVYSSGNPMWHGRRERGSKRDREATPGMGTVPSSLQNSSELQVIHLVGDNWHSLKWNRGGNNRKRSGCMICKFIPLNFFHHFYVGV